MSLLATDRSPGTVSPSPTRNQVMGDGIMALFGTPLAHEDHAGQACYATLAGQVIHDAQYSPEEYPEHTGY